MNAKTEMRSAARATAYERRAGERGAALATSLILLVLMGVVAASILTVATAEVGVAGNDLQRMRTQKAAEAALEDMTNKVSDLFVMTSDPSGSQLAAVAANPPVGLEEEGFTFNQEVRLDCTKLTQDQCNRTNGAAWPRVVLPAEAASFSGLYGTYVPYSLRSTATFDSTGTEATMVREINTYMLPVFQFGIFSDDDVELHPDRAFVLNGRVHANGNVYVNGNLNFLDKLTAANEVVTDVLRNGRTKNGSSISVKVGNTNEAMRLGSVTTGPNFSTVVGARGYSPGSPNGSPRAAWDTDSTLPPNGGQNQFGGQVLTRSTGAKPLRLPLQIGNTPAREIIKRRMPNDSGTLANGRYHSKASVRILLGDEDVYNDASGIPENKGVELSETNPLSPYYFKPSMLNGGKALWVIDNAGAYVTTTTNNVRQGAPNGPNADTVRNVRNPATPETSAGGVPIPGGAGVRGRVYIEIVKPDGTTLDVTRQILSMGMTVGEPNAIVNLQQPLWAAFTQANRDRSGGNNNLEYILNNTLIAADGEIRASNPNPFLQDNTTGYIRNITDDDGATQNPFRAPTPPPAPAPGTATHVWGDEANSIVPINVYNVREGWINSALNSRTVYSRGITTAVSINMRNLVRWLDGVYDANLLANTPAVSGNVNGREGYIVYFSDRRGDRVKSERDSVGAVLTTTNGTVDNEDIYGPNGSLDSGEDVLDSGVVMPAGTAKKGTLQKDTAELPDPAAFTAYTNVTNFNDRVRRAKEVSAMGNTTLFRRALRLFNGANLRTSGEAGKLSLTKGLTVATENMVYLVGNYNTAGISAAPSNGTTSRNDGTGTSVYLGNEVPASIVADAVFPLSKTWFDALPALFPEGGSSRRADAALPSVNEETSVRAAILAGTNLSALAGTPDTGNGNDSRLSGGIQNFPRFLEDWDADNRRWNYVGSFVPLFRSTQALGPWYSSSLKVVYGAPVYNWAFDSAFNNPARLPPGTPNFQYVEPTGFRLVINH